MAGQESEATVADFARNHISAENFVVVLRRRPALGRSTEILFIPDLDVALLGAKRDVLGEAAGRNQRNHQIRQQHPRPARRIPAVT